MSSGRNPNSVFRSTCDAGRCLQDLLWASFLYSNVLHYASGGTRPSGAGGKNRWAISQLTLEILFILEDPFLWQKSRFGSNLNWWSFDYHGCLKRGYSTLTDSLLKLNEIVWCLQEVHHVLNWYYFITRWTLDSTNNPLECCFLLCFACTSDAWYSWLTDTIGSAWKSPLCCTPDF